MTLRRIALAATAAVLVGFPLGFAIGWYWAGRDPLVIEAGRLRWTQ